MQSKPNLLIVADRPPVTHWLKKHLDTQFSIIESNNEFYSLQCVEQAALEFIIVDSELEACDPLMLCQKLRQINRIVPILLITGRLKKAYRNQAIGAGVTDFLNSELHAEELATCIKIGLTTAQVRKKTEELSSSSLNTPPPIPKEQKKKWSIKPKKEQS